MNRFSQEIQKRKVGLAVSAVEALASVAFLGACSSSHNSSKQVGSVAVTRSTRIANTTSASPSTSPDSPSPSATIYSDGLPFPLPTVPFPQLPIISQPPEHPASQDLAYSKWLEAYLPYDGLEEALEGLPIEDRAAIQKFYPDYMYLTTTSSPNCVAVVDATKYGKNEVYTSFAAFGLRAAMINPLQYTGPEKNIHHGDTDAAAALKGGITYTITIYNAHDIIRKLEPMVRDVCVNVHPPLLFNGPEPLATPSLTASPTYVH